ncbi:DUF6745 domain-containing protein [Streptomyces sp. GS7]|uniref:DUF6745 domain-containing protein n=1 Tax=Streptomyces sp. GS7 TaxID=2692234 RepID=UPI003FA7B6DA
MTDSPARHGSPALRCGGRLYGKSGSEPDGTHRTYRLRVPPWTPTAQEGLFGPSSGGGGLCAGSGDLGVGRGRHR